MDRIIRICISFYIFLIVVNTFLLPPLNIISLDNFLFPFTLVFLFFLYAKNRFFQLSFALAILLIGTKLVSNHMNEGLSLNEFLWSIRVLKQLAIGWSVYYMVRHLRPVFEKIVLFGFLGLALINSFQLLEWKFILDLYSAKPEMSNYLVYSLLDARIFGVFTNPNSNGLILGLFAFYFLLGNEKYKYILVFIASTLLIMSQSRTVFLVFTGLIIIYYILFFLKRNRKLLLLFLGGTILLLGFISSIKLNNLSSVFNGSAFISNSVKTRFKILDKVVDMNQDSYWFGQGKIDNIPQLIDGSIDNEFLYVYLEYGIIGIITSLLSILFLFFLALNKKMNSQTIYLLLIMLVSSATNLTFNNIEVSGGFILLFSAALFFQKNEKSIRYN